VSGGAAPASPADEVKFSTAMLEGPVRRMLGSPVAEVLEWTSTPITGGLGPATTSLARISGTAMTGGAAGDGDAREMHFSLIFKAQAEKTPISDPGGYVYWKREVLAYSSGLLESLPDGMRAPRCYGVDEVSATVA
jgi:hypothetical protein